MGAILGTLILGIIIVGLVVLGFTLTEGRAPALEGGRRGFLPTPDRQTPTVHKRRRESIPKSVKMYVWQRDGGRCVECGSKEKLEYDHIIPFSEGGSNTDRNLQLLCEPCNRSKGSKIG